PDDFFPFLSRPHFELADFLFRKDEMSGSNIDQLMEIMAAFNAEGLAPFADADDIYETIDSIELGDVPWKAFHVTYSGPRPAENVPKWMTQTFVVWFRDPRLVLHRQLGNPDYVNQVDYTPKHVFNGDGDRVFQDVMSGDWSWKQADIIAEDPRTHGASFCPVILGSDKTTVSVATGQNDYWPLYISNGMVHNDVRRARHGAVSLLAFLATPKTDREHDDGAGFRAFRRELFHGALRHILMELHPYMTRPDVVLCSDGHYRSVIYGLGPYIADYPEQCLLACTVQGWCPKCTAKRQDLDGPGAIPRSPEHTDALRRVKTEQQLWDQYGVVSSCEPFTADFPRANIHELLAPDLLHQVIKGTFKDHLVTWVEEYLVLMHGKAGAARIMADIDRRIAAAPLFPGLRRFPEGRRFKQWTGNDSKALMKVFLAAAASYIPAKMSQALSAFLDFCYLVRRPTITAADLRAIDAALTRFHEKRVIFEETGVRLDGFSLPRQHSLGHYPRLIQLFGAPSGLSSSITESKHIEAVKKPYRRSNRYEALGQMLLTNQRLDKLFALRVEFTSRGMLQGPLVLPFGATLQGLGIPPPPPLPPSPQPHSDDEDSSDEAGDQQGNNPTYFTTLAKRRVPRMPNTVVELAFKVGCPQLPALLQQFLYDQEHPSSASSSASSHSDIPLPNLITVLPSAIAHFHASELQSRPGGLYHERIRSVTSWRSGPPRHDCAYIVIDPSQPGFRGLEVVRIRLLFSIRTMDQTVYPCALASRFIPMGDHPCSDTGMWIVRPEVDEHGQPVLFVLHLDQILRAAHLIGNPGDTILPTHLTYSDTLDVFTAFYVNKYIDYHAHQTAF
ncbi:hypothetical protein FKP32DRAFT_1567193, partial [Trametes sanguinea]